jgi:enoyl-[acyl-carrier protein] reductase II
MSNRITELFQIQYPIVQAGMVWNSGWKLASASSNAGVLGLLGAGSMYPEVLREHIQKCKKATDKPFGVNVPMLYPDIDKIMAIIVEEDVKIVFISAGNPKTWTAWLKEKGITVVHVVSSVKFALKAQGAGVDAVVAEGFEAGVARVRPRGRDVLHDVQQATRRALPGAGLHEHLLQPVRRRGRAEDVPVVHRHGARPDLRGR